MKKAILIFVAMFGLFFLYSVGQGFIGGFMDAARHGGSPAARERRLNVISTQQNIGLPKDYGEGTVMLTTKAGPGLRFTYVIQLTHVLKANVDMATLTSKAKKNLMEIYRTNPAAADFRKWEVEICWQYLDKDGNEITTIGVTPKDL